MAPHETRCPGCNKSFKSAHGYSNHKRQCKLVQAEAAARLQLRRQNLNRRDEAAEEADREGNLDDGDVMMEVGEVEIQPGEVEPPVPATRDSGLPNRRTRLPARYQDAAPPPQRRRRIRRPDDELPAHPPPLISLPESNTGLSAATPPASQQSTSSSNQPNLSFQTLPDSFGVYRVYPGGKPIYTPDESYTISDAVDSANIATEPSSTSRPWFAPYGSSIESIEDSIGAASYAPFLNISIFLLMTWFYTLSTTKSHADLDRLVNNVILHPDFSKDDFFGFRAAKETKRMDDHRRQVNETVPESTVPPATFKDQWIETSVLLFLPCDGAKHASEDDAPKFEVKGLYYRSITEVIKSALAEPAAEKFHLFPFESYWKPGPNEPEERIYSEAYTTDFFLQQYEEIRLQPRTGDKAHLVPVILGLMIWSDSTHLASFGTASLWPIYLYFANQSKYTHAKPSSFAAHHLAYIPKLGDDIQEAYKSFFGKLATAAMLTHLRRELMQSILLIILNADFIHAYIHGIVLDFVDNDPYIFFPRFFTDSADYPEKILMTCLRYLAQCPCPRCLILKSKIPRIGMTSDMKNRDRLRRIDDEKLHQDIALVRQMLFVGGVNITSAAVDTFLKSKSLWPTRNAFSLRLFEHGFNFYQMFVPDLMHEFELGVWKLVFTHLMRILHAYGHETISILNSRYRNVPPFGRSTIRRFHNNASAMKKLAARDFEDLLQCAIPVFEGLLPDNHDKIVRMLLFELATWHAFAKLRLHTETTLNDLDNSTTRLGDIMRKFDKNVCSQYSTKELPSEHAARSRRQARKKPTTSSSAPNAATGARHERKFNMETYKLHALGDYVASIRLHGTSDSFTTQLGELEHRRVKRFYPRVRKGMHTIGIAKEVQRERLINLIKSRNTSGSLGQIEPPKSRGRKRIPEVLSATTATVHHHISAETREKVDIIQYLDENEDDPALTDFYPRLLDHLLARLLDLEYDGDEHNFTDDDRATVIIENDRMYRHRVVRVNYTSYDNRRAQDTINPRTRPDIMMLSSEDGEEGHPYWYARVLDIFHARVLHVGERSKSTQPQHMEFLLVRWFGRDTSRLGGWEARRLHRIGFVDANSSPFGFVNPAHILRAVHLIPAFAHLETKDLLGSSKVARRWSGEDTDWRYYYIDMFVDRDMVMRFRGGGVGHKATRAATDAFKGDRHKLDKDRTRHDNHEQDADETMEIEVTELIEADGAPADDPEVEEEEGGEWESEEEEDDNDKGEEEEEEDDGDDIDGVEDEANQLGFTEL